MFNKYMKNYKLFLLLSLIPIIFLTCILWDIDELRGKGDDPSYENKDPDDKKDPVNLEDLDWGTRVFIPDFLTLTPGSVATEIRLNWLSEKPSPNVGSAKVRFYGDEYDFHEIEGNQDPITAISGFNAFNRNTATVTGLTADVEYKYWVSSDGINWSKEFNYNTPKQNSFRFAAISCAQLTVQFHQSTYPTGGLRTWEVWRQTMGLIGNANVNFIASVGDQVDTTVNGSFIEYEHLFFPPQLRSIPFAPSVGNHDRHYPFRLVYNIPNEQEFTPLIGTNYHNDGNQQYADIESVAHYWYRYNNTLFVVLNSSANPANTDAAIPFIQRFDLTLKEAKAASPGYTWLIVQHHKTTTAIAGHCGSGDIYRFVYAGFEELMSEHGVDFVLAGHDHSYTRSFPMTGKKGGIPSVPDRTQNGSEIHNPNGVIYLSLPTSSGIKYYELFQTTSDIYPFLADGRTGQQHISADNIPIAINKYNNVKIPGFTIIEIEGNRAEFNFYRINDTETPIDSFVVTK